MNSVLVVSVGSPEVSITQHGVLCLRCGALVSLSLSKFLSLRVGHLRAFRTQYLQLVCDEAFTHQVNSTPGSHTVETFVVPMPTVEGDEFGAADT